ncbi:apolipoprotein N-acyltransferase [Synechococcus lacustris]|uniref:apolipoprotein N-acyltransferase n=1 Tax=Synechococcus lacustris TaxID=2116544 RepID=UPI0020CDFFEE|nr:apolipoprotein N-acyltransferase [Synechococcus lacustris]MCP9812495.1 apolipoprotein N-acyltransferase [Synechococcus lacustris Maggiore-St4-Slac]
MKQYLDSGLRNGGNLLKDWLIISKWWGWLPLGAGALAGVALPPLGWPWLLWIALLPLWRFGPRGGAVWGAAAVLVSHRWLLALHPLTWLGVPAVLSLPLVLLLLGLCSLAGAALLALWCGLLQWLGPSRLSSACFAALLWGLTEVLLAKGPLFWLGLGAAALPGDRPLAGLAAFGGAGLVAAMQLLISWLLWRQAWPLLLFVVLTAHGLGAAALALNSDVDSSQKLQLEVVQPALPTREKFEWEMQQRQRYLLGDAILEAEADGSAAVVLPEGALPEGEQPNSKNVAVISGGFRRDGIEDRSSLLWFPAGNLKPKSWLDKHRLVPIGEWVPGGEWLQWSGLSAVGGLQPGSGSRLLNLPNPIGPIAGIICYELADGASIAAATREGAEWLLAVANLDPYPLQLQQQFLALAQLRAIETSKWLLSVANTGPTAVVDPSGLVINRLKADKSKISTMKLSRNKNISIYSIYGEKPIYIFLCVSAIGIWRNKSIQLLG